MKSSRRRDVTNKKAPPSSLSEAIFAVLWPVRGWRLLALVPVVILSLSAGLWASLPDPWKSNLLALVIGRAPKLVGTYPGALKPYVDFIGFADGSLQIPSFGCPNGEFWAVPLASRPASIKAAEPINIEGAAWVGPLALVARFDTDLPKDDYVRISSIAVRLMSFSDQPKTPAILMRHVACNDSDPGGGTYEFLAVLPTYETELGLLRPGASTSEVPEMVIRQQEPTTLRLEVHARRAGWYLFRVDAAYRYRGEEYRAQILAPTRMYFPEPAAFDWYYSVVGEDKYKRLPPSSIKVIIKGLNAWAPYGFPAKPASDSWRSGLRE